MHHAPLKALISVPGTRHEEDLQYQPSDQQVRWDLYSEPCLMNESFPLICLSKHTVSKGWIVEHIKYMTWM